MKNRSSLTIFEAMLGVLAFGLLPQMQAVSPAPDGCYPGFTTAEGCKALNSLTTGAGNTGVGWYSLFLDTSGNYNTGVGGGTLALNNADSNTAVGTAAMLLNTSGGNNTAVGTDALLHNDDGFFNTAVGDHALFNNTTGDQNTALGQGALSANIDGNHNTATGQFAMLNNDHGTENVANGYQALPQNTGGAFNVAVGNNTLFHNTTGGDNTAIGDSAGFNQDTGSGNVYIGDGMSGVAGETNHTYIRNIQNTIISGGGTDYVTINLATGLLGHLTSARRYKENIQPMDKASEALYQLKPVTYRFKKEIDPSQSVEYGLVAEEVAQVDPNLAIHDGKGQIESVRYMAINVMLLNEFLKEHRKNEEQQRQIEVLTAQLKEQSAQIEKVTAQLELSKPMLETVGNN